jgi:hypothetical protein
VLGAAAAAAAAGSAGSSAARPWRRGGCETPGRAAVRVRRSDGKD